MADTISAQWRKKVSGFLMPALQSLDYKSTHWPVAASDWSVASCLIGPYDWLVAPKRAVSHH